jgi:putative SOS response-associated peptidase YedK
VPTWAKDASGAARMINARAETITSSRAYAQPFALRRCLVPADGWYEWRRLGDVEHRVGTDDGPRRASGSRAGAASRAGKRAYFMCSADGTGLTFAGIWSGASVAGARVLTCSLLTVPAVGDLALIHDRMPLVLPPERWAAWLTAADATDLLRPADAEYLATIELRPVGAAVGDVRNDGPELVRRVDPLTIPAPEELLDPTLF